MNDSLRDKSSDPWLFARKKTSVITGIDENDMKFSDNFEPQMSDSTEEQSIKRLADSHQYIKSLGNCLASSLMIFTFK